MNEYSNSIVRDHGGKPLYFITHFTDITESKKALDDFQNHQNELESLVKERTKKLFQTNEALRESEKKFRQLIENINEIFWIRDAETNELLYMSPNFEEIWGLSILQVTERPETFLEAIHPDDHERVISIYKEQKNDEEFELEYRIVKPDGTVRWINGKNFPIFDDSGKVYRRVGINEDITDRKRAEEALSESEKQFRQFFENLTIGVAVYEAVEDGEDFVFIDMNSAGQKLSKVSIDEIRGKKLTQIFPGARGYGLFEALQNTWRTGEAIHIPFHKYKDERITQWVENRVFRLPSGRVVAVYDDRTELMRLEKQLQHAQQMESIGTLSGGIAHDFNNILSSIIGFTELGLDQVEKNTELEDDLQEVLNAGYRAKDLVKQILAFARKSEEETKPMQPSIMTKEVLKFIRSSVPTSIDIQQNINSDSFIMANPTQIHQILMNLCTNAAHAMENHGGLLEVSINDISAHSVLKKETIDLKPGDYVQIRVSDTGTGIPDEIIPSIFDPYFTTKGLSEGTGLGLSVVHGIVETYGGKITVASRLGEGSTFTIYLPIAKKRKLDCIYTSEDLSTGSEKILYVDDETPIAKMGRRMLEQLGYSAVTRNSSIEALELFRAKPDDFDLVITDMTMPNITGDILASELMGIRPDIPVILCTGFSKKISAESASEIGIKAFVNKPFVKSDLAKTIRRVLDEAKG